jgi:hypothetical protein
VDKILFWYYIATLKRPRGDLESCKACFGLNVYRDSKLTGCNGTLKGFKSVPIETGLWFFGVREDCAEGDELADSFIVWGNE